MGDNPTALSKGQQDEEAENLRIEYSALSAYFTTIITFRVTLLGFYVAALAFIGGNERLFISPQLSCAGLFLTVPLFLFELRNQSLYRSIGKRAIYIERKKWGFSETEEGKVPFYSTHLPAQKDEIDAMDKSYPKKGRGENLSNSQWARLISHTLALNLLYGIALLFFSGLLFVQLAIWGISPTSLVSTPISDTPSPILIIIATSDNPTATVVPTDTSIATITTISTP